MNNIHKIDLIHDTCELTQLMKKFEKECKLCVFFNAQFEHSLQKEKKQCSKI